MLVEIKQPDFDVELEIAYATNNNFTKHQIYKNPLCYLHEDAAECLQKAMNMAGVLGYRFKIFDAYRPVAAQWKLWEIYPSEEFVANPERGSPHNRGVAVDLTLIDKDGKELDMGTGFDDFTVQSHHGRIDIPVEAQRNRAILLGIMSASGWDFFKNEWWHYQLFDAKRYPLLDHIEMGVDIM